jgi:hypothetical protein
MPRADRATRSPDGHLQCSKLVGGRRQPTTFHQRVDPPQPAPHRGSRAVGPLCQPEHVGGDQHALGAAGRAGAGFSAGV